MPASLLVAWLATISIPPSLAPRQLIALLLLTLFASIAQYYFINRPGPVSRSGMRYDEYAEFGKRLRNLPAAWPVFSDLPEYCPMCEYYAGRQIIVATNPDSARAWLTVNDFPKGVWVEASGFQFVKLDTLSPENPETKKPARR